MANNSENYYKEHSLFNNISNVSHRAWNRLMTVTNLHDQGRNGEARGYLDKLDSEGRASIGLLVLAIKKKGLEKVKAELNRSIVEDETTNNS